MAKESRRLHAPERDTAQSERDSRGRSISDLDPRMHDALTDLHAYAMALEADWQRLGERLNEPPQSCVASLEWVELVRRHAEMTEELQALRATTVALRAVADAAGNTGEGGLPALTRGRCARRAPRLGGDSQPGA